MVEKDLGSPQSSEAHAVSSIQALGGKITRDDKLPGRPVIVVSLAYCKIADTDLRHLKELKDLRKLYLGDTKITDAGLKELRELKFKRRGWLTSTTVFWCPHCLCLLSTSTTFNG